MRWAVTHESSYPPQIVWVFKALPNSCSFSLLQTDKYPSWSMSNGESSNQHTAEALVDQTTRALCHKLMTTIPIFTKYDLPSPAIKSWRTHVWKSHECMWFLSWQIYTYLYTKLLFWMLLSIPSSLVSQKQIMFIVYQPLLTRMEGGSTTTGQFWLARGEKGGKIAKTTVLIAHKILQYYKL